MWRVWRVLIIFSTNENLIFAIFEERKHADGKVDVSYFLLPLNRGVPRRKRKKKKKKADRRARACLVFPILWTLDPLSLGFNFCPLFPPSSLPPAPPRVRSVFLLRGSSHSSFVVVDLPTLFRHDARGDNAVPRPRLWNEAMYNATAIRSRAPASGRSLSSHNYFLVFSLFFFSFFFFFIQYP